MILKWMRENNQVKIGKKVRIVEYFSGIGAFTQAISRWIESEWRRHGGTGEFHFHNFVEIVDSAELDRDATISYNAINGTDFQPKDVNDVDVNTYGEVDWLSAGWPCQDVSTAGKGAGVFGDQLQEAIDRFIEAQETGVVRPLLMEKRSGLIFTTIQNVQRMTVRPKLIFLENVKGLLNKKYEKDMKTVQLMFDGLGYEWQQVVLNSKYFGVPQSRERVFMILKRKDVELDFDITKLSKRNTIDKVLRDVLDFSEPTHSVRIEDTKKVVLIEGNYYFKNEMAQYTGKDIQLNIEKFMNQKRGEINKVATLGELSIDGKTLEPVAKRRDGEANTRAQINGINGINRTLSTRPIDGSDANKIAFAEVKVNQVKSMTGVDGQYPTYTNNNGTGNYVTFDEVKFQKKKSYHGVDGVVGTLRAGDCADESKVAFKSIPFGQDNKVYGVEGISPTLLAGSPEFKNKIVFDKETIIHYRRLSALECWRLMGFTDEAFEKVALATVIPEFQKKSANYRTKLEKYQAGRIKAMPKTQPKPVWSRMTKQAGNSIVVNCIDAILEEVFNG